MLRWRLQEGRSARQTTYLNLPSGQRKTGFGIVEFGTVNRPCSCDESFCLLIHDYLFAIHRPKSSLSNALRTSLGCAPAVSLTVFRAMKSRTASTVVRRRPPTIQDFNVTPPKPLTVHLQQVVGCGRLPVTDSIAAPTDKNFCCVWLMLRPLQKVLVTICKSLQRFRCLKRNSAKQRERYLALN